MLAATVRAFPEPDPVPRPGVPAPRFGGGGGPPRNVTGIANTRIALLMVLVTETMFFTGLVGAYLLLRYGNREWPPVGEPRLPLLVTWLNSAVLLASGGTFHLALRAVRRGDEARLKNGLGVTAFLGCVFLAVQGSEWLRLLHHGMTLQSSVFGATFYTLIGVHAVHVVAAVAWLLLVYARTRAGRYAGGRHLGVELCSIYWNYVCALWVVLFVLVYLM